MREQFIKVMSRYIQREYRDGCYNKARVWLPDKQAKIYSSYIYDAAVMYSIDPFLMIAIPNHETYFMNMRGDTDRGSDYSEGMFQILRSTQKEIYQDMVEKGMVQQLVWRPGLSILPFMRDQTIMASHFIKHFCTENFGSKSRITLSRYNTNPSYTGKVLAKYNKAVKFYNLEGN